MPVELRDAKGRLLELREPAATAARLLKEQHPEVIYTSGKRDLTEQAVQMARNTAIRGRSWLTQTYKPSIALDALVSWCAAHPHARQWPAIASGFGTVLRALPPEEAAKISRHLGGLAFDVQPVAGAAGEVLKASIRALPHLELFLDHEGGLVRWHAQFKPLPEGDTTA